MGHPLEAQVEHGAAGHREAGLEPGVLVCQRLSAEFGLPGPADGMRIGGVEDDVLEVHALTLKRR